MTHEPVRLPFVSAWLSSGPAIVLGRRAAAALAALALLGLGGCASIKTAPAGEDSAAKRFEAPAGLSRIYIYRNEFLGTLVGLDLSVDGQVAGTTKGKTFVIADVPPGEHEIVSKGENTHQLRISTQVGQPSFVWQEVKMGLLSAGSRLHAVDAATGRAGVNESSLVHSPLMQVAAPAASKPAPAEPSPSAMASPAPAVQPSPAIARPPAKAEAVAKGAALAAPALAPKPAASAGASASAPASRFEFEAERTAMEQAGCRGPGGIRPSARLLSRQGHVEIFELSCAPLRVRCDTGMCQVLN